jgi:excisionase family DNA binding protein
MQPQDLNGPCEFLTARELAAETKLSYPTILRLIKRGKIKANPHCRHKRIPVSELERWKRGEF